MNIGRKLKNTKRTKTIGITPFQRIGLIGATGLAAALSVFLSGLVAAFVSLTAIYLFALTFAATYFGLKYARYFYALFLINLSAVLGSCIIPTLHENLIRVIFVIAVTIMVMLFQFILMPGFIRKEIPYWTIQSLKNLNSVIRDVFACFLQPEYADNMYLFEKRLHDRKKKYLRNVIRLREMGNLYQEKTKSEKLDGLFDVMMDCAQLRRRVSDHTIFALCAKELAAIVEEINKLFAEMMVLSKTKIELDTFSLGKKISLFEDNFQNVLRVVAREPLAFLLFIAALKEFREKVELYASIP